MDYQYVFVVSEISGAGWVHGSGYYYAIIYYEHFMMHGFFVFIFFYIHAEILHSIELGVLAASLYGFENPFYVYVFK